MGARMRGRGAPGSGGRQTFLGDLKRAVPMTRSQRALAAVYGGKQIAPATNRGGQIFIVASPRSRTGKTFLAQLLTDFLSIDGDDVQAFDLNPSEYALAECRPAVTQKLNLNTTQDQVALFDRLIVNDGIAKVVDVGQASTTLAIPSLDRKSTRLNSSHLGISYAVFCLKKK